MFNDDFDLLEYWPRKSSEVILGVVVPEHCHLLCVSIVSKDTSHDVSQISEVNSLEKFVIQIGFSL